MPRIPDDEIERIKKTADLAALVRARGIELRKHGSKDLVGKCPFHADGEASFIVSPEKGLYHCMGCGAAGNAIQFVGKFDGISFRHAFELLNAGTAAFTAAPEGRVKVATVPKLESPLAPDAGDGELMLQAVGYYHERLAANPAAIEYLRKRGIWSEEAAERFRIGFADRTLGLRLPDKNRREGEAIRTRLQALGLFRESGHEHFNGSVVVPVFNEDGSVGEIYGRKIRDDLRPGTPKHLYLPGPHEGVWNLEALQGPELILCEAVFDALTFWVNGFRNVTTIYGTEGFTDELFDALLRWRVKRVRIAYDADDAGNRAAARDAARLMAVGIEVFLIKFPWGMDANEYARKVTPAGKALETVVNAAEWLGNGGRKSEVGDRGEQKEAKAAEEESCAPAGASSSLFLAANSAAEEAAKKEAASLGAPGTSPAVPVPCLPSPVLDRQGEYHLLRLGPREYRVGGLEKNNSVEVLKVSLRLRHGEDFHLDSFDLARDGERRRFIERAAEETRLERELIKRDLGKLLLLLEQAQHERIQAVLSSDTPAAPDMTNAEREAALAFLRAPNLVEKIGEAFDACGLVGEAANRLAAYLACTSRKLDKPLAVIIQSTSAAGKSTLMEAVLQMFPEEERVKYSAMTGQSLYYLGETNLKHKILAIVEEEGAEKASYALKLLQSERELTIASTGKDPQTGRMETQEYHVEGPVSIFLTTTAVEIDEELMNRCLILSVDESREQTGRIHALQRQARTLEGLRRKALKPPLLALMRNVQRLVAPLNIMNPWADELTFPTQQTRTRRDNEKYLGLIDAITLLHQHQRPLERDEVSGDHIRVTLDDIALANELAPELLGRSLDELPPQTRRVFEVIKAVVRERCEAEKIEQPAAFFSRKEVRARLGWSVTQIRAHLERLGDLEYVAPRYGKQGSAFQYELLIDCRESANKAHIQLLDIEVLRRRSGMKVLHSAPKI
jgi:DNA primase